MSQADIQELRCRLAEWDKAHVAALSGSSYTVDGLTVTRQDVESVIQSNRNRLRRNIIQLEAAINGATSPSMRVANLVDRSA